MTRSSSDAVGQAGLGMTRGELAGELEASKKRGIELEKLESELQGEIGDKSPSSEK